MSLSEKLDAAYNEGIIAFVSAKQVLIPIYRRDDIRTKDSIVEFRYANQWVLARYNAVKFVIRKQHASWR